MDTNSFQPEDSLMMRPWREKYLSRPIKQLPQDLVVAFDRLEKCRKESEEMRSELSETRSQLKIAELKIWVLGAAVTVEGAVLAIIGKQLLAHLMR